MRLTHERFTDQEGVEAGVAEAVKVRGGMNAAFGNVEGRGRKLRGQFQRSFEADVEGAEVAIVDAEAVAVEAADTGKLFSGMDFAEDVKLERAGGGGEASEFAVRERRGDEEDGVGVMGAGFDDLVFVHDEIFAEAGKLGGGGGEIEVGEAALEERLISEDRERGGAGGFEFVGQGSSVEVITHEPPGGRRLLQLGDDGGAGLSGGPEGAGESAGRVSGGRFLEQVQRRATAAFVQVGARLGEDAVEVEQREPSSASIAA